jgi:hypothetical protein
MMMCVLRITIIFLEFLGTILIWLDTVRINARTSSREYGLGNPLGDLGKYKRRYYRQGLPGFGLLFAGILLQAVYLFESKC